MGIMESLLQSTWTLLKDNMVNINGLGYYSFNLEPKSKNAMKISEKIDFQEKIARQMTKRAKKSYRSKIIAEFSITPSANNPPHIHTAIKNYLIYLGNQ